MSGARRFRSNTSRSRSFAAVGMVAALVLVAHPASAALPATSTPVLTLDRTIRTTPFVGSTISTRDAEGSAYVPRDGSLWVVGDQARLAMEIDPHTGALKRSIDRSVFEAALPLGGGGSPAGANRSGDLESIAYDVNSDTLYIFSGSCCTASALPTAFRLTRAGSGQLVLDSYRPLPTGSDYTAAGWNSVEDAVYVGKGSRIRTYNYATNTFGAESRLRGISGMLGMGFSENGADLLIVTSAERLFRINWSTRRIVNGWNLDLTPFSVKDSRAVDIIPEQGGGPDQIYVVDGFDARPTGDPLKYAVFVFDVSDGGGGGPTEFVRNPGFEVDTSGWAAGGVATLTRVAGGHDSGFAARLSNDGTASGSCLLNDSPNWVMSTTAAIHTASMWVRADVAGAVLRLRLREFNGGTIVGSPVVTQVALTTSWQLVTVSHTPQAPGSSLDLSAFVSNAPPGVCFYADDVSISTP